jgi:hypothetical protein
MDVYYSITILKIPARFIGFAVKSNHFPGNISILPISLILFLVLLPQPFVLNKNYDILIKGFLYSC